MRSAPVEPGKFSTLYVITDSVSCDLTSELNNTKLKINNTIRFKYLNILFNSLVTIIYKFNNK